MNTLLRHGDLLLSSIAKTDLPKGFTSLKTNVLAEGEATGHTHRLVGNAQILEFKTENGTVDVFPGAFIVHPPGELHEYINGPERTMLFRVRYGKDMESRVKDWPSNPSWQANESDKEYFQDLNIS